MPVPSLNEQGLLPSGIHDCSLDELQIRFGSFQETDRRILLFQKLVLLLQEVRASGIIEAVIVDGSFVTSKSSPGDIDLLLILPADCDERVELSFFQYNVIAKKRLKKRYGFDVFSVISGTTEYTNAVTFFGQVRDQAELCKGMLRIVL